jgi:hypothetical protein
LCASDLALARVQRSRVRGQSYRVVRFLRGRQSHFLPQSQQQQPSQHGFDVVGVVLRFMVSTFISADARARFWLHLRCDEVCQKQNC